MYLRDVRVDDVNATYRRWMNSPDIVQFLESRFHQHSIESLREYVSARIMDRDNVFLAIVLKDGDRHIGNIKLGPINWIHRFADIGILIGEKDCWGKGYAAEAIKLLSGYAFDVLNLHKLTAGCYDLNQGSLKAFQKVGFEIEGVRRQQFYSGDRYVDHILLGLVATNSQNSGARGEPVDPNTHSILCR